MVGTEKIYQGIKVIVMGIVNGDEVVIMFPDGSRKPIYRSELTDVPAPAANRPIITKGVEANLGEPEKKLEATVKLDPETVEKIVEKVEEHTLTGNEKPEEPVVIPDEPAAPPATEPEAPQS